MAFESVDRIPDDLYPQIEAFSNCTLYHTRNWHRSLNQAFGWQVRAVLERDDVGNLVWLLPFVNRRRMSFKSVCVCLPISHHVGLVGVMQPDQPWDDRLVPLEIHSRVEFQGGDFHQKSVVTLLDMSSCVDEVALRKRFHKDSIQRKIDKAEKSGLYAVKAATLEQIETFERMQAETRWRQGSPTYPRGFFRKMWESLNHDQFRLHLVYRADQIVAGIIFLHFRDTALYGYGASVNDREVWQLGANQLAMWSAIREAYQSGIRWVDFGTSPLNQPELQAYKEKWGGVSQPLYYTYAGIDAGAGGVQRDSSAVRLASWVFRHLPLPLFARISPLLFRRVV